MPNAGNRRKPASVEDFQAAVVAFSDFHPTHAVVAPYMAQLIADHATPVGSGTVARTARIPIRGTRRGRRDRLDAPPNHRLRCDDPVPRIKGKRREVRRTLAQRSGDLPHRYRPRGADSQALSVASGPAFGIRPVADRTMI